LAAFTINIAESNFRHTRDILDTAPDIAYDEIGELAAVAVARHRVLDEMRRWVFWRAANPSSPVQCPVGAKKQIIGLHQQDQRVDSWPGPAQRSF
jgi:hypothetical protein